MFLSTSSSFVDWGECRRCDGDLASRMSLVVVVASVEMRFYFAFLARCSLVMK